MTPIRIVQFRRILALAGAGCLSAALPAYAADRNVPVLIGSYTSGGSPGIHVYGFDSRTGHFDHRPRQIQPAENPSWIVLSHDRKFIYAVDENGPGQKDPVGRVSAYRVNAENGHLTPINQVNSLGAEPTHASLSSDGRYLFVANYSVLPDPGGTLAVIPIRPDGGLAPVTQIKTHQASRVDPKRQSSPHVHSSVSSPDGNDLFVADLGADRVYIYQYNSNHPEAPLSASASQASLALPPGSGPRHLVLSKDGKHGYLTLEMAGKVAVLNVDKGMLSLDSLLSLAAEDFKGTPAAGAIHLSPDGRFLDVLDRGDDNQLVTFLVNQKTGALTFIARRSVEGNEPREFAFDSTGRFLLVANQKSHQVVVFARDTASGRVSERVDSIDVDDASDVTFVR